MEFRLFFPMGSENLDIQHETEVIQGHEHIVSFTITTPEGMEYKFGNSNFYGVDTTSNTYYYLPNFYTYPELKLTQNNPDREDFGAAKIDVALFTHKPLVGPRKRVAYGNTYERNYKITQGPNYTSAWHLISIRSKLTQEQVTLEYDSRDLTYYSDKSYTHTFPNFGIENGNFKTLENTELNPTHPIATKWENGRAVFAYSATETQLHRWHLTEILTDPKRGELARFLYNYPRGELVGDKVCSRIEIHRDNQLYKGWELIYTSVQSPSSSATCNPVITEDPAPPPITIGGETVFDLGELYPMKWFEYNGYFHFKFTVGCITIPIRIPLPFLPDVKEFGHQTRMSEYGSLMFVKALNQMYDESKEKAIFNAEKKRTFLQEVREIDRLSNQHPFLYMVYHPEQLPKRFDVNQDRYGYYVDNSLSGSPLPRLRYASILGDSINASVAGAEKHFPFQNVLAMGNMHLGRNNTPDLWKAQGGSVLQILHMHTGASYGYNYTLNKLPSGDVGAGLRVSSIVGSSKWSSV